MQRLVVLAAVLLLGRVTGAGLGWATVPVFATDPFWQMHVAARDGLAQKSNVMDWYGKTREVVGMLRVDGRTFRFLGACNECDEEQQSGSCACPEPMKQENLTVGTVRTEMNLVTPDGSVSLVVNFLSSVFAEDALQGSRPVVIVMHDVTILDSKPHDIQVYIDISSEHCSSSDNNHIKWERYSRGTLSGYSMGVANQTLLSNSGDRTGLNWGYMYVFPRPYGNPNELVSSRAGKSHEQRTSFAETGKLPDGEDGDNPRVSVVSRRDKAVISVARNFPRATGTHNLPRFSVMLAYDDVASASFYGERLKGIWTQQYRDIAEAVLDAAGQADVLLEQAKAHERAMNAALESIGGSRYAELGRLAYRQTLAALKVCWHQKSGRMMTFLKEISTNGDMNTVDVIYPASPVLLVYNPKLLASLLIPVLELAANATSKAYSQPFSPHEIGTYPIADHGTSEQELMPMENSGNMLLMILGILQRDNSLAGKAIEWIYPRYWNVLRTWADNLVDTLPFPEEQLCTDDFNGKLANNTNLAAKAIVAVEAFAEICTRFKEKDCTKYSEQARAFAQQWQMLATEVSDSGLPHSQLAYGLRGTYSLKYNLVWQQLLRLKGPFPSEVLENEVQFYKTKANKFGVPLDSRNPGTKLDWLSWVAAMASDDSDFQSLMEGIYRFIDETPDIAPLEDLYDTQTGKSEAYLFKGFRNRPVVGAVFARVLKNLHAAGSASSVDKR